MKARQAHVGTTAELGWELLKINNAKYDTVLITKISVVFCCVMNYPNVS